MAEPRLDCPSVVPRGRHTALSAAGNPPNPFAIILQPLLGLDDVFAFVGLLAREVDRTFEEAEHAVIVGPAVIAVAMIAGKNAVGRGRDRRRGLHRLRWCRRAALQNRAAVQLPQ
jgi:hypothetical protein